MYYYQFLNSWCSSNLYEICINLKINERFTATFRNIHRSCSLKKAFLKNIAKFIGKHLCWSLFFEKFEGIKACNFIKMRLQHRCFPVNIAKFLRKPFSNFHAFVFRQRHKNIATCCQHRVPVNISGNVQ